LCGKYLAFGLVVESPVDLPEAAEAIDGAVTDVMVVIGDAGQGFVGDEIFHEARAERCWWHKMSGDNHTMFNCPVGLYEIKNGREIVIQPYPDGDEEILKIYLLGSAMGAIQVQRGRIPLHGGAVVTSRGAMVITGSQGAGKSTMTSAFVHLGYRFITDDVSSIVISDGQAMIVPAYPQRKLTGDALAPFGYDPDLLPVVDKDRDKYGIRDRENWQRDPVRLSTVIELSPDMEGQGVSAELVTGHDKLSYVMRNIYRGWMHVPGSSMSPHEFKKLLTIAAQADIYRVGVPRGIEHISDISRDIADALHISADI